MSKEASKRQTKRLAVGLDRLGDEAIREMENRPCAPRVLIQKTDTGWDFVSPYRDEDRDRWTALLFQAFGTRHGAIMDHFMEVLTRLLPHNHWDEEGRFWFPDQGAFDAMIAIIHSLKPENEAQAAYAAQLVALHFVSMKLAESPAHSYWDPRTTALLCRTVQAYGDGLERFARLQGRLKPRHVNQTIQVVYVDNRDQRALATGGGPDFGGQPHGTARGETIPCAALPCPGANDRAPVPLARREGQARMPFPRWGSRLWRALRGA